MLSPHLSRQPTLHSSLAIVATLSVSKCRQKIVLFINSSLLFQYSPVIDNFVHVHHILVYICAGLNETEVNNSALCIGNVGESLDECRGGEIIASWAVGGGVSSVGMSCHQVASLHSK